MKKLLLLISALTIAGTCLAQSGAIISGRLTNLKDSFITVIVLKQKNVKGLPFHKIRVDKNGSFRFTTRNIEKPFRIDFQIRQIGRVSPTLFFADGYNLQLTADVSSPGAYWKTLRITGAGSEVNRYWKDQHTLQSKQPDTIDWFARDEASYLAHFKDSLKSATAVINRVGKSNDANSGYFHEQLLREQDGRSAITLYAYSFNHRYNYDQTNSLLSKAGLPNAHDYLRQWPEFATIWLDPPHFEKPEERWNETLSMQKDRFVTQSILCARFSLEMRKDVAQHPGFGQPFQVVNGKRIGGDAYDGLDIQSSNGPIHSWVINAPTPVELAGVRINEKNAASYRYRLSENGVELIGWSQPAVFKTGGDGRTRYAYFGTFDYKKERTILLEIKNLEDTLKKDAILIDWRELKKPIIDFSAVLIPKFPIKNQLFELPLDGPIRLSTPNFIIAASPDIRFRLADSMQSLSFTIHNNPETYEYYISLKRTINGVTDVVDLGKTNTKLVLQKTVWNRPGTYTISFTPRLSNWMGSPHRDFPEFAKTIRFTVMPALDAPPVFTTKQLINITLGIVIIALFTVGFFRIRHYNREAKIQREKEMATLRLHSVRSQLNPHFMFNALAGIQNLMNRNEPDAANLYLSKFARLTRYVLDENEKDLVSITSEVSLLEDYLQMEQMRFGFNYTFEISDEIDKENTEIPSMLLQPFVENAVKHGVSGMNEKGLITIRFIKRDRNIVLEVHDNGRGYDQDTAGKGKGIDLSKNRMILYNTIYKESTISFDILADQGTLVTITLKDWI